MQQTLIEDLPEGGGGGRRLGYNVENYGPMKTGNMILGDTNFEHTFKGGQAERQIPTNAIKMGSVYGTRIPPPESGMNNPLPPSMPYNNFQKNNYMNSSYVNSSVSFPQPPPQQAPPQQYNDYPELGDAYPSCMETTRHIYSCPACASQFNADDKFIYSMAIILLAVLVLFLFHKLRKEI